MLLPYSKIRDTLKTGDLISWRITKVVSTFDAILFVYQKILKTRSVHTGIVVKIGGRLFVAEARPPSVRLFPLSKMDDFDILRLGLPEDKEDYNRILRQMGVPYGFIDLLKGILGFRTSLEKLYCSEHCAKFYVETGFIPMNLYSEAAQVPDNLLKIAERLSGKKLESVHIDRQNLTKV